MDRRIEMLTLPQVVAGRARGGRPTQQDAVICLHDPRCGARLLVLADGMGGDGAGEVASAGVVDVARRLWEQGLWRQQPGAQFLETLCQEAHLELRRRGRGLIGAQPHSTIVAMLMQGTRVCWVHVGDSRLYRFHGRRCLDRTEDHSVAQLRVRRGELSADQLATAPDQHQLLRGLGGPQPPQVDHGFAALRPGQAFALCSDGVWEQLSMRELAKLARRHDQRKALVAGLNQAMNRGGEAGDNVALILLRVGWREWWSQRSFRKRLAAASCIASQPGDVGAGEAVRAEHQLFGIVAPRWHAWHPRPLRPAMLAAALLATLAVAGCAQMHSLKARMFSPQNTPAPPVATEAVAGATPETLTLGAIVNTELQHGHYVAGKAALHRYLAQHPGDRLAEYMLRQLTVDPEQMLGHASRGYVVRAGDSFSGLAARYLGDPSLFLILARYNHSTDPSQLAVGETIRLPTAMPDIAKPRDAVVSDSGSVHPRAAVGDSATGSRTPASPVAAPAAKAARFQAESVVLLDQGHKLQALARLGEALDIDPQLPPSGAKSVSLRQELLANYHQRAVILYRDQQLDQAIALWNHVLAIDPSYEPALIYRAQALELKQRLQQFRKTAGAATSG